MSVVNTKLTLFMLLLGCRPPGRNTEQHDVFFGIGETLKELIPMIKSSWPEAKGNIHIDAWRKVTTVEGYYITVISINPQKTVQQNNNELFFINLGGYRENEFEEFHYKMLVVAASIDEAKRKAKQTTFFKHFSIKQSVNLPNATAHIDDKFGIDVDDAYTVKDILPATFKAKYSLVISEQGSSINQDELYLGYLRLTDL